ENDGLDVAGIQFVVANKLAGDVREVVDRMREIHAIDFRGVDETLHVFAEAENGRSLLGFIAADTFENSRAVADNGGKDGNLGIVPVDEFSVVPDFLCLLNRHLISPVECDPSKKQNTARE